MIFDANASRGNITKNLLWENASPTSEYGLNTRLYDLSNYDAVEIVACYSTDETDLITAETIEVGYSGVLSIVNRVDSTTMVLSTRQFDVSSTGVKVNSGYYITMGSNTNNVGLSYMIPLKIYGVKWSQ